MTSVTGAGGEPRIVAGCAMPSNRAIERSDRERERRSREGSQQLLAAIARHHPERVQR